MDAGIVLTLGEVTFNMRPLRTVLTTTPVSAVRKNGHNGPCSVSPEEGLFVDMGCGLREVKRIIDHAGRWPKGRVMVMRETYGAGVLPMS
jgi:hypothetical protein